MAYLQEQMEILKFDKRLLEINLKNGSLSEEDYKAHLAKLADLESQSEKLVLEDSAASSSEPEVPQSPMGETNPMMEEAAQQPITPPNSDPFGSGF